MKLRIKYLLVHLIACLLPLVAYSQGTVSFEASADAKQVVLGGYFEVSFTLNNANGSNFLPPSFNDFNILSGPSQSTSVSSYNGVWSRSLTYSYTLQPLKVGKFRIGHATITANGKAWKTKPLTIGVVKGRNSTANTHEEMVDQMQDQIFIQAEPNTSEAYVGEQILLDYKLYTTKDIETYNLVTESEYPGFFAQDVRRYNGKVVREVIDGVQFSTKVLKRVALFPQQAGLMTIDPMVMRLAVIADNKNQRRRSFFFTPNVNNLQVKTEAVKINIKSLPVDSSTTFTGATGHYSMNSVINRRSLTTDEAITLKMTITGDGDIKRVQSPTLSIPDSFDLYEPRIIEENSFESNGRIIGKKVIEYLLLPKETGRFEIQPAFTYFDTDSMAFVSIAPTTHHFVVSRGNQTASRNKVSPQGTAPAEDIRFIKTDFVLHKTNGHFLGTSLFWVLSIFPLLVLGGIVVFKQIQANNNNLDMVTLKNKRARKVAQKRLTQANKHLQQNESKAFYDEVSRALFGYICDKLNIPLSELTKQNVQEKLQQLGINEVLIEEFMEVVQTCEMALFAGKDNTSGMAETYEHAIQVVSSIEQEIGTLAKV